MKMLRAVTALCMMLVVSPVFGMTRASAPAKFSIPFANSAPTGTAPGGATYPLPTPSQIGVKCGAASLTDGFPSQTMQPVSAGGCAPLGQDTNGIIKQITQWNQQNQMGAAPVWDSGFSSSIGGYPEGSILSQAAAPSCLWISQVDNNTTDPDTGGAGWTGVCPGGGAGGTSTGSGTAQVITATPFALISGAQVCWTSGFTTTPGSGNVQINVNSVGFKNLLQRTQNGLVPLIGGEFFATVVYCAHYDGAEYELDTFSTNASLVNKDQTLYGGANVSTVQLGTVSGGATVTMDCGTGPLQVITNAGAWTLAAPAHDGSCMLEIANSSSAGVVSFSGFATNSNTGEPLTTTNGSLFVLTIWRIQGVSSYLIKALQ
jgi:hypothetical protein